MTEDLRYTDFSKDSAFFNLIDRRKRFGAEQYGVEYQKKNCAVESEEEVADAYIYLMFLAEQVLLERYKISTQNKEVVLRLILESLVSLTEVGANLETVKSILGDLKQ